MLTYFSGLLLEVAELCFEAECRGISGSAPNIVVVSNNGRVDGDLQCDV